MSNKKDLSSIKMNPETAFLRLINLTKCYNEAGREHEVLGDMSISFSEGEFTAILGKSGTGKTTILNLISGIDRPEHGEIYFGTQQLTAMNDLQRTMFRGQNIGFIFQFYNLIPTLTVWENVILPLELNGMMNKNASLRAINLLDEVGLLERKSTFPDRLSGGEQQRVAIARALVHNPLLVLADEPTGNLDEERGKQVLEMLDRLTRRAGKNLILVTHNNEAAQYADRILILQGGKLIESTGAMP